MTAHDIPDSAEIRETMAARQEEAMSALGLGPAVEAVSYTHLRAHETQWRIAYGGLCL